MKLSKCENDYLEMHFNKERTDDNDITFRINKTRRITKSLNGILGSNEIAKQRKITICNNLIKSTLMYRSETWRIKEHSQKRRSYKNERILYINRMYRRKTTNLIW